MIITTKFDLNHWVYPIVRGGYDEFIPCDVCNGEGKVIISNKEFTCPACYGRKGRREYIEDRWNVSTDCAGIIGKIDAEKYGDEYPNTSRTIYMLSTTGVGTGTLWPEEVLFPTKEEAQAECDKRNSQNEKV